MKALEVFLIVIVLVAASTEVLCIGNSTYQVKECDGQKCEPNDMKIGICEREGQILQLGGKDNIVCQSPAKICGSLETKLDNNRKLSELATEGEDEITSEINDITTQPQTSKPNPTSITPSTEAPSNDVPIEIPEQANETISSAVKQVQEITNQLIDSGIMKPTEISISAQNAMRKEYEKLPIPTAKSTENFINLVNQTSIQTIKFENAQSIDMSTYNNNIKLENIEIDGNSKDLVIQPRKRSNKERRSLENGKEEEEEEATIQLFDESSNIVYENSKINIISRDYINQNKPIIIQSCNGIFKGLQNSIIRNVEINIYNDIIFDCKDGSNEFGILTNKAKNVTFTNIKIKFNYNGIRTISINSNTADNNNNNIGLLVGESKESSMNSIYIYGDIVTVKGDKTNKEKVLNYGNLIGINGNTNISNCYIDLSFVLLYQNIIYGGIVGNNKEKSVISDSYVYISSGIRIGVEKDVSQFIYGGLVGKNEGDDDISILTDWINLNILGIEINSTTVNFGGIIGSGKVSIIKSSLRMAVIGQSKFYIDKIENSGYVVGSNNDIIELKNSTINYDICSGCLSPIMSYQSGNSSYPTKKTESRELDTYSIENNYVFGTGINQQDYKTLPNGIVVSKPLEYCNGGNEENGICYYTKYTPNNRPQISTYFIVSTEGMDSKISSNSKLLCPNKCNLNGICQYGECRCFPGFTSFDCKLRTCPYGSPISNPANEYNKDERISYECSNQGKCNRKNGLCECFNGYEGNACQRTKCPNQCSNHGICTTVNEAILYKGSNNVNININYYDFGLNYNKKYDKWDSNIIQLCVCDKEYTGVDCSIRKCPYGYLADSECDSPSQSEIKVIYSNPNRINEMKTESSNDKYLVYLKYTDPNSNVWFTNYFSFHLRDEWLKALGSLPNYAISIEDVEIDKTKEDYFTITITFSEHQTGRQNPIEIIGSKEMKEIPELSDVKNGFYHWINPSLPNLLDTDVGKIAYEMEYSQRGYECSNNGICDTKSGICSCFDGFEGHSCSKLRQTF